MSIAAPVAAKPAVASKGKPDPKTNPAAAAKPVGALSSAPAPTFEKIAKSGAPALLKVRDVHVFRKLQARDDTDSGSTVDEGRCQSFALKMEKGEKFPAIKVMKVMDAPQHKNEEVYVCWDGMHTLRAKEIAKLPEVDCLVWSGTFAQAQFLAASRANREHEANGKPLSSRDKIHAVKILAAAYKESDIPKKDWPSNRAAADIVGCSRQLVNEMDPFERGQGDKRETVAAKKRADRATKSPAQVPHWEIVQQATGQVIASYDAANEEEALKINEGHHPDHNSKVVVRKQVEKPTAAVTPGTEKPVGFDWAGMDSHLGYLVRGWDGLGDIFGLKGTPEFKAGDEILNAFATKFNEMRKAHSKKPVAK